MARIRTVLFASVFYSVTIIMVMIAFLAALIGRSALIAVALAWTRIHAWCASALLGIRVRVEGAIPKVPVLIAAKHQAMFETLELVRLVGSPAAVVKRELAEIPAWGWAARRYGVIPVDRSGGAPALRKMMQAVQDVVADGRSVMIFPEGTRVLPGEQPRLQPGFAGLYRAIGLPVVPVALDSGKVWPRKGPKRAGIVTIRFGEPIAPGLSREEIKARVHTAINALEREGAVAP
jgi:1-acyl-sn-glycerol-3-phosphate acyltransferase